jgi:hypothetical protein
MLIGTWAGRMAVVPGSREWLVTRAAAAFAVFNPMLLGLQDRLANCDPQSRLLRDVLQPYQDDALAWARTLPQPLLSLDSWLPYRAGVANDLSDPIAYTSYCLAGGKDPVAERVRRRYYACIVTSAPADGADYKLSTVYHTFWPALRRGHQRELRSAEQRGGWLVSAQVSPGAARACNIRRAVSFGWFSGSASSSARTAGATPHRQTEVDFVRAIAGPFSAVPEMWQTPRPSMVGKLITAEPSILGKSSALTSSARPEGRVLRHCGQRL